MRYKDHLLDLALFLCALSPLRLSLICAFLISGEENELHAMKWILYYADPLTIARLVGVEFFSPTGLTHPSQVRKFNAVKNKLGLINELILIKFIKFG